MNKNIFKTLFVSFIVLFSALFINIDGVKADCTCYYTYDYGGQWNTQDYSQTYTYIAIIHFTDNSYEIKATCEYDASSDSSGLLRSATAIDEICSGNAIYIDNNTYKTFEGIRSKFKEISQNCSVEECDSINLHRSSNNYLRIGPSEGPGTSNKMAAITFQEFQNRVAASQAVADDVNNIQDISGIHNWAGFAEEGKYDEQDVGTTCSSVSEIGQLLSNLLWIINIIAIVILIIMTAVDFIRAVVGSEEDTLKKAFKNFVIRAIIIVILLLLPLILGAIIRMTNKEMGTVQIGENGQIFCNVAKDQ